MVARNVCRGGTWDGVREEARPYVRFENNLVGEDVGFEEPPPRGFRLRDDSAAYTMGFEPIPLDKIGIQ